MGNMDSVDVVGRKAMLEWLSSHISQYLSEAPDVLWHYTDANGVRGILAADNLWATNARFLNDSEEIAYGMELATKALASHDLGGRKPATIRFIQGLGDPDRKIVRSFLDGHLDAFVACFCGDGDLLSQWRAYAGNDSAGGYAIGFRPAGALPAWPQSAPGGHDLALRRVLYDRAQQDTVLRDLITSLLDILDTDPADIERQKAFAKHLVNGLVEAVMWCKHPAFEEEQEWRIVYIRSDDPNPLKLRHRVGRGLIIPFVELAVPRGVGANFQFLPVAHINCGPSAEPDLKQRGVRSLLDTDPRFAHVTVGGSLAPLRL